MGLNEGGQTEGRGTSVIVLTRKIKLKNKYEMRRTKGKQKKKVR